MAYNIIPIIIIIIALLAIIVIIVRKFPKLVLIDVTTIVKERDIKTKEKIIEQRIERFLKSLFRGVLPIVKGASIGIQKKFRVWYQKILILEKKYQKPAAPGAAGATSQKEHTGLGLEEAERLASEGLWNEAEERYIQLLSDDPKSVAAYNGLVELYWEQKDYVKTRETALYLLKLALSDRERAELDYRIAECFERERDVPGAYRHLLKAVELSPNNPKYLDFLLEVSILLEEKDTALDTYEKFREINPDNQKLPEYKAQIEAMIVKKAKEG